ncbi:hypothetical protein B0F90DRAFT_1929004 [Multifurca ochricompacta]|uniref:Uncharacterized protein n=1 Tax=Multifurca ochricompacta TaxID=376703 RepID=A0AAD4LUU9_9AGAM|nr:hypothetical protein B0F90DRAFT_1929004 [Multifurca ochricompacta]
MSYDCHLVIQEVVELYLSPPILCLCPVSVKQWGGTSSIHPPVVPSLGVVVNSWGSGNVVDMCPGSLLLVVLRLTVGGCVWFGGVLEESEVDREACMSVESFDPEIGIRGTRHLLEGSVVLALSETLSFGDSGKGTRCRLLAGSSFKLWSVRKVKVETVKDQSSHSIKANHRGPGSRLKVKAIKSKLIQDCQSELQEPRSTFKRPTSYKRGTRARSELKQWQ